MPNDNSTLPLWSQVFNMFKHLKALAEGNMVLWHQVVCNLSVSLSLLGDSLLQIPYIHQNHWHAQHTNWPWVDNKFFGDIHLTLAVKNFKLVLNKPRIHYQLVTHFLEKMKKLGIIKKLSVQQLFEEGGSSDVQRWKDQSYSFTLNHLVISVCVCVRVRAFCLGDTVLCGCRT